MTQVAQEVLISSHELAEFITQVRQAEGNTAVVRHDHVTRKVDAYTKYHGFSFKEGEYKASKGGIRKCYELTKNQAYTFATDFGGKALADKVDALMLMWQTQGKTSITKEPKKKALHVVAKPVETVTAVPAVVEQLVDNGVVTMTSLEIVEFINQLRKQDNPDAPELRHDNFLAKVESVLGGATALKFKASYLSPVNGAQVMYRFPKREATLMAMSYSHKISAQVYDRMEELERKVQNETPKIGFEIPQTFAQALMLAAQQAEALERSQKEIVLKEAQITLAQPKVLFHDSFVKQGYNYRATDIAKKLGISAAKLNTWLVENNALYQTRKHFKQWYIDKGFGVEKFVENRNTGDIYQSVYHTDAGAAWILANFNGGRVAKVA